MGALIIDLPYCFMRGLGTISMTCHIECDSENGPGLVEHDGVAYIVTNPPPGHICHILILIGHFLDYPGVCQGACLALTHICGHIVHNI